MLLQGLGAVYSAVSTLCEEQQAPDLMLTILEERRGAGGGLAPTSHNYASTLSCLGKVTLTFAVVKLTVLVYLFCATDVGVAVVDLSLLHVMSQDGTKRFWRCYSRRRLYMRSTKYLVNCSVTSATLCGAVVLSI